MTAYGGINPSAKDIVFPYDAALAAAEALWTIATKARQSMTDRVPLATHARLDWSGQHRESFDTKFGDEETDTTTMVQGCEKLALDIAEQCAKARGEQNRINWARWVNKEIEDDNWAEDGVEFVAGEDDYGDPPGDPATPSSPGFAKTASWRLHGDFGP